jgi:putative flippase GtrA
MTASSFVEIESAPPTSRIAVEFARYFACSVVALGADFALFSLGLRLGLDYPAAAAAGFIVGLWLAYQLSIRFVFRSRTIANERVEFMVFAGIGLAGLLLTEALLWLLVARAGFSPLPAKLVAAGLVFCFNFGARRYVLFTRSERLAA